MTIKHEQQLPHPNIKIQQTRPSPSGSPSRLQRLGNRLDRTCGPYHASSQHWSTPFVKPSRVAGH
jgi:hypothetical protein